MCGGALTVNNSNLVSNHNKKHFRYMESLMMQIIFYHYVVTTL